MTTAAVGGAARSTRKKDDAPRGVFRHESGVWAIRFVCGGCGRLHEERVGPLKRDAISRYHTRKGQVACPRIERQREQARLSAERDHQRSRITFRAYAADYVAAAKTDGKRSWARIEPPRCSPVGRVR